MNTNEILELVKDDVERHEQPKTITELRACLSNSHYLELIGAEDIDQEDLDFLDWILRRMQLGKPPHDQADTINMIKSIISKTF